jgi:dynein heavy chain, axonemal
LIQSIAEKYINPEIMKDGYKFSKSGLYYSPVVGSLENYIAYIESLPSNTAPEACGMHNNV